MVKDKRKKKGKEPELSSAERGKNIRDIIGPIGKLHNLVIYIRKSANYIT
jgi:hypothetical protein